MQTTQEGPEQAAGPKRPEYKPKSTPERLAYLVEECGEVLAAAGKSMRFGYSSSNPELPADEQQTNGVWLRTELCDLQVAIQLARESMDIMGPDDAAMHSATDRAARALPMDDTPLDHLLYLLRICGKTIKVVSDMLIRVEAGDADALELITPVHLLDLEYALRLVRSDLQGFPARLATQAERDAAEKLFPRSAGRPS